MSQSNRYSGRYPKLPPMKKGSKKNLFGDGVGKHLTPLVSRQPKTILPNLSSFDPQFLYFLRKLTEEINENVAVDLSDDLFTRTGNFSNADSLRTVSGYMMNPMSYIPRDNAEYRASLGLKPKYTADEREIALNVWKIIFSEYTPTSAKVNKKSNSGVPRNTHDAGWKKDFAEWILHYPRTNKMLDVFMSGDFERLRNEFEIVPLMTVQKRDQVDTPGKPREVIDRKYAITNGREGGSHNADKTVVIDGVEYPDFSATRARVINAGPWSMNCVLSPISSGTMKSMFSRFPKLFHVNTEEEIKSVIDGSHIFCGDVKEYDRSMSDDAIDVMHEGMSFYWDERIVKFSRSLYHSAYYSRPLELDGEKGVFVGNYEQYLTPQVKSGNRSGHAFTSLMAKGNKVIDSLIVMHHMGMKVKGNELSFLMSEGAINLVNNGDDEIVYTPDIRLLNTFKEFRKSPDNGHYLVNPEEGQAYSGKVLRVESFGDTTYKPSPRPLTPFQKMYCPERSIGGNFRPYWAIGFVERANLRGGTPAGEQMWEIHDRLFHDLLAPKIGSFWGLLATGVAETGLRFDALTAIDKEVLEDPDKIYYKYSPDEVSDDVINQITTNVPYESFKDFVENSYRGNINEYPNH